MRIAIVNDMPMATEVLRRIVAGQPDYQVAWVAANGVEAVHKCARDLPDLILMDLLMPAMDGVEATRRIMKESPCAILLVTATVSGNSGKVFEAMGHGALDAVNTPVVGPLDGIKGGEALLAKIATISRLIGKPSKNRLASRQAEKVPLEATTPMIAIGASTGGPVALAAILSGLPSTLRASVVIVQHVDVQFAPGMAEWLSDQGPLKVDVISEGCRPQAGSVWLAGTNDHLVLRPDLTFGYTADPRESSYRPSVDVFFRSLLNHWPRSDTAVLLTGMGRDGAEGLLSLRRSGWHTIAQDEPSCVVYGMPKAAAEIGAAIEVSPLKRISSRLAELHS